LNLELYEERAILLSRISNHEKALEIYVHILKDNRMAEKYEEKKNNNMKFLVHLFLFCH